MIAISEKNISMWVLDTKLF